MAVIVVMTILAILLIFVAGNLRTLHFLNRDLQLLERQQVKRLRERIPSGVAPSTAVLMLVHTNAPEADPSSSAPNR